MDKTRVQFWVRFRKKVMDPYLVGLQDSLDRRFQHRYILGGLQSVGTSACFLLVLLQATCACWSIQGVGPDDGNDKAGLAV